MPLLFLKLLAVVYLFFTNAIGFFTPNSVNTLTAALSFTYILEVSAPSTKLAYEPPSNLCCFAYSRINGWDKNLTACPAGTPAFNNISSIGDNSMLPWIKNIQASFSTSTVPLINCEYNSDIKSPSWVCIPDKDILPSVVSLCGRKSSESKSLVPSTIWPKLKSYSVFLYVFGIAAPNELNTGCNALNKATKPNTDLPTILASCLWILYKGSNVLVGLIDLLAFLPALCSSLW